MTHLNPKLALPQPYPFEKLAQLHKGVTPPAHLRPISLGIGEPKHASPDFVRQCLIDTLDGLSSYPTTKGLPALRDSIARWCTQRFKLPADALNPEQHVLPVNGTREALFSFTQAMIDRDRKPLVLMPNPFYQIYEGAAFLAGAEPYYLPTTADTGFIPDYDAIPESVWKRCALLFVCSPGNPTGAVTPMQTLKKLLTLSEKYGFIIAGDECYSELYFDENAPPPGLLQAATESGNSSFQRCVVFHSLSKRSNLPGMRSGFIAGDAALLKPYLLYRTYHGAALPVQHQHASIAAWNDEAHVKANREAYREKFTAVLAVLQPVMAIQQPDASFYLWPKTPLDDQDFARRLYQQQNVVVLPGSYLSRTFNDFNPGAGHVRMALVAPLNECVEAAQRIRDFVVSL